MRCNNGLYEFKEMKLRKEKEFPAFAVDGCQRF